MNTKMNCRKNLIGRSFKLFYGYYSIVIVTIDHISTVSIDHISPVIIDRISTVNIEHWCSDHHCDEEHLLSIRLFLIIYFVSCSETINPSNTILQPTLYGLLLIYYSKESFSESQHDIYLSFNNKILLSLPNLKSCWRSEIYKLKAN